MEQPYETRILFLGLDGVGKSTIIAKLRDFKVFLLIITIERRSCRNLSFYFLYLLSYQTWN